MGIEASAFTRFLVLVQFSWATSDLWLIQQNKFCWISHRSMVAQLNCTDTASTLLALLCFIGSCLIDCIRLECSAG